MARERKPAKPLPEVALLAFVFALAWGAHPASAQDDIALAAERGLRTFLRSIPEGQEPAFGFAGRAEFDRARPGLPYRVCTILPRQLAARDAPAEGTITPLGQFRFPVLCDGKMRALLTVALVNGQWEAVEIGAAGLAAALERVENNVLLPEERPQKILLRLYQLQIDFAGYYPQGKNPEDGLFVPLPSALMAIGAGWEEIILFSYPEVLKLSRDKFTELPETWK